jgi:hypothetical protein
MFDILKSVIISLDYVENQKFILFQAIEFFSAAKKLKLNRKSMKRKATEFSLFSESGDQKVTPYEHDPDKSRRDKILVKLYPNDSVYVKDGISEMIDEVANTETTSMNSISSYDVMSLEKSFAEKFFAEKS